MKPPLNLENGPATGEIVKMKAARGMFGEGDKETTNEGSSESFCLLLCVFHSQFCHFLSLSVRLLLCSCLPR